MTVATVAPTVVAPLSAPAPGFATARAGLGETGTIGLSALHFGAALGFLLLGAAGLAWVAPSLARGIYLDQRVAAVTHLLTLGWLTTTIFGALYQLLPVALGTPIRSVRAGYTSVALLVPGILAFAAGVAMNHDAIRHLGIALVMPALLAGIVNVGASLPRATRRDLTWWSIAIGLAALATTIVLGGVLVHSLKTGMLAGARVRVLSLHVHVALAGWAFAIVIGISERLLPMFLLAHGVDARWSRRALVLVAAGTAVLAAGLLTAHAPATWAGAAALALGVASYVVQARRFYAARVRRRLDPGLRIVATGACGFAVAAALGLATLAAGTAHPRIAAAYGLAAVLSVMLYVVGHFYKIVPFLAWIVRYRGRMGREPVPAIADLYSARVAFVQWIVMTAAACAIVAGTLAGHAHCIRAGSVLLLAGVLLFASQVVRIAMPARSRSAP